MIDLKILLRDTFDGCLLSGYDDGGFFRIRADYLEPVLKAVYPPGVQRDRMLDRVKRLMADREKKLAAEKKIDEYDGEDWK